MINLLKVFVSPGKVFESMRSIIPPILPLVPLVLSICIFTALAAWYMSDDEYLKIVEVSAESSKEMSNTLAEMLQETFLRGDLSDEEVDEILERQRELTEEQQENMTSASGIQSARKIQTVFAPLGSLFGYGLLVLLEATYFFIAGNMMQTSKQWSDWIGFTLWSMLPLVLYLFLSTLPTIMSGSLDPYSWQAPLSWISGLETNVFALTLTIPTVWIVWIRVVGMHKWIEKPVPICLVVVLIPALVGWLFSVVGLLIANPYTM